MKRITLLISAMVLMVPFSSTVQAGDAAPWAGSHKSEYFVVRLRPGMDLL